MSRRVGGEWGGREGGERMLQTSFSLLFSFFRVGGWRVVGGVGTKASPSALPLA